MACVHVSGALIQLETDCYHAAVRTEGYVSGVAGGSFADKKTGAHDLGFGLDVVDFLLEPVDESDLCALSAESVPAEHRYHFGDTIHGNIPKRYVELPQICTHAKKLPFEIIEGDGFVAVKQWFKWNTGVSGYKAGSLWEQWLVFPDGVRYFFGYDKVTSVNDHPHLLLRIDMPGHVKHERGDSFEAIFLSYHGVIPSIEFIDDFAPDERFLYRRDTMSLPERFIRAYKIRGGPWLAGMTVNPSMVYEAWCHQRGYVCFIQEIGGYPVRKSESFGAVHLIGYFDDIPEMECIYDQFKGACELVVKDRRYELR